MAKKDFATINGKSVSGVWRTVGGQHIFIRDGQSLASAMKESGKFKSKNKSKKEDTEEIKYGHAFDVGHYTEEEMHKNSYMFEETKEGYMIGSGKKEGIEPKAKDRVIYNMSKERLENLTSDEKKALKGISRNNKEIDNLIQENTDIYNTKTSRKDWVEEHRGEHGKHTHESKDIEGYHKELDTDSKEKIKSNEEKIKQLREDSLRKAEVLKKNEGKYSMKDEVKKGKSSNQIYMKAYREYLKDHPNSKLTFTKFKKMNYE